MSARLHGASSERTPTRTSCDQSVLASVGKIQRHQHVRGFQQVQAGTAKQTATDGAGAYRLDLSPGRYEVIFSIVNSRRCDDIDRWLRRRRLNLDGTSVDSVRNLFGPVRLRYFGPRPLIEDNSVRSKATSLVNLEGGYKFSKSVKLPVDVFDLFDAQNSDIDYYYTSRLPGEPLDGVADIHLHPTLPRTRVLIL